MVPWIRGVPLKCCLQSLCNLGELLVLKHIHYLHGLPMLYLRSRICEKDIITPQNTRKNHGSLGYKVSKLLGPKVEVHLFMAHGFKSNVCKNQSHVDD